MPQCYKQIFTADIPVASVLASVDLIQSCSLSGPEHLRVSGSGLLKSNWACHGPLSNRPSSPSSWV